MLKAVHGLMVNPTHVFAAVACFRPVLLPLTQALVESMLTDASQVLQPLGAIVVALTTLLELAPHLQRYNELLCLATLRTWCLALVALMGPTSVQYAPTLVHCRKRAAERAASCRPS